MFIVPIYKILIASVLRPPYGLQVATKKYGAAAASLEWFMTTVFFIAPDITQNFKAPLSMVDIVTLDYLNKYGHKKKLKSLNRSDMYDDLCLIKVSTGSILMTGNSVA